MVLMPVVLTLVTMENCWSKQLAWMFLPLKSLCKELLLKILELCMTNLTWPMCTKYRPWPTCGSTTRSWPPTPPKISPEPNSTLHRPLGRRFQTSPFSATGPLSCRDRSRCRCSRETLLVTLPNLLC